MNQKPKVAPGAEALIVYQHQVLLILRDDIPSIPNPNRWCLPGGGIEEGETELEALLRELQEEVDLVPQSPRYLDKTSYPDGNTVTRFLVSLGDQEKARLKLGEGQRMEFFNLEAALQLDLTPNLRSYLTANLATFKLW